MKPGDGSLLEFSGLLMPAGVAGIDLTLSLDIDLQSQLTSQLATLLPPWSLSPCSMCPCRTFCDSCLKPSNNSSLGDLKC